MTHEVDEPEDTDSLIEQLDEALCTLLHSGDEIGTHAPREHLDLFYARQAARQAEAQEERPETCCDNCETPIDGDNATTSEVCWDCWRAAKAKIAELEAKLEAHLSEWATANERADAAERDLRIAKQAFALVPPPTPEDSAVLAATDKVPESWLRSCVDASQLTRGLAPLAAAILDLRQARRAQRGGA